MRKKTHIQPAILLVGLFVILSCAQACREHGSPAGQASQSSSASVSAIGSRPTPEWPQFTREKGLEIPGASNSAGDWEVAFEPSKNAQPLRVRIDGNVPGEQKLLVTSSASNIRIAPGLRVPANYFIGSFHWGPVISGDVKQYFKLAKTTINGKVYSIVKEPLEVDYLAFKSAVVNCPLPRSEKSWIVAGEAGAALRKRGKALFLVKGDAHLEQ